MFTGASPVLAAPAPGAPGAPVPGGTVPFAAGSTAHAGAYTQLRTITALSAERLATADLVAAAKWGTGAPIDDPAREQVVLDSVRLQAVELGADPEATVRIFRDQIEANKLVQRGLHRLWTAEPGKAPVDRPDLAEVRKEINRLNTALVRSIAEAADARSTSYCRGALAVSVVQVRHEKGLDRLHTKGLARAVPSVCADGVG
ncbi:gamma subclass chorismate mutase AroQ [Streptomyces sp. NPDC000594]|uniref:gamma subclass chorismate mutase AroQ n=1 Tax=Streptomyces sp. NPDC000594 TaxID=3154261 RepID=UPI0033204571